MIFTKNFLYLHFPKTGGIMLTQQLLANLKGDVTYTIPKGHASPKERWKQLRGQIRILEGLRHENIEEANQLLRRNNLSQRVNSFECILLNIRNPYDYMVSRYHYLRDIQKHNRSGKAAKLATEGDFKNFAINLEHHYDVKGFILNKRGAIPAQMKIIKYEEMAGKLNDTIRIYLKSPLVFTQQINQSRHDHYLTYIKDKEIESAIYERYQYLFDQGYYKRLNIS